MNIFYKTSNNNFGDYMKVSWIKSISDNKNFKLPELLGFDVFSLKDNENIDKKIDELISKEYNTIVISKDLAGFSQKINSDYIKNKKIDIIINNK